MHLGKKYPDWSDEESGKLCGAVINDLFGTSTPEKSFQPYGDRANTPVLGSFLPSSCRGLSNTARFFANCGELTLLKLVSGSRIHYFTSPN